MEGLYDLILSVEQVKRDEPLPEEEQEKHDEWYVCYLSESSFIKLVYREEEYDALMDKAWDELRVLVPLETRFAVCWFIRIP